jgi:hypothetical protein
MAYNHPIIVTGISLLENDLVLSISFIILIHSDPLRNNHLVVVFTSIYQSYITLKVVNINQEDIDSIRTLADD